MQEVMPLERRGYGPDSSPDDAEAIKSRVYMHAPDVVMYWEVPVITGYQLELFFNKINELTADKDSFYMLIDLTDTKGPDAEMRSVLRKKFTELRDRMTHAAVFTGKNMLLNTVAKFVMARLGLQSFSIHKTLEQAEEALNEARRKAAQ